MPAPAPEPRPASLVRDWFARLRAVHAFVQTVSSTVRDDLAGFSRQTLEALIGASPLRQGALIRYCHAHDLGLCRPQTFDNLRRTFRDLVDELGLPVHEILLYRGLEVARTALTPPYAGRGGAARFRAVPVAELCGDADNARALRHGLLADVPATFWSDKPDLITQAVAEGWTVDELCREIMR